MKNWKIGINSFHFYIFFYNPTFSVNKQKHNIFTQQNLSSCAVKCFLQCVSSDRKGLTGSRHQTAVCSLSALTGTRGSAFGSHPPDRFLCRFTGRAPLFRTIKRGFIVHVGRGVILGLGRGLCSVCMYGWWGVSVCVSDQVAGI